MKATERSHQLYKMLKINADTLTPIRIFKQLTGKKKFLLESSFDHENKGKYSYIGANPYQEIIGSYNVTTVIDHHQKTQKTFHQNALNYIRNQFPKLTLEAPLPFMGGAVGYIGYDAMCVNEEKTIYVTDALKMPDVHLMIYKDLIVYEHQKETAYLIAMNLYQESEEALNKRLERLKESLKNQAIAFDEKPSQLEFSTNLSKQEFIQQVDEAKKYIEKGEALQIVISQRMEADITGDPLAYYRQLRFTNPSPYMFYVDFSDYTILGASPESLIQTTGRHVFTNPIAGTRKRGESEKEDQRLMKELLADEKEVAEHHMLVERSRKDLLTVCEEESISIPIHMEIEKFQHVMHIVTEVHGTLKENKSSIDALMACLPAGTVSGEPKQRAMEIIHKLEKQKRGFYGGGIGYISYTHDLNIALAIRSMIIKDQKAYVQAGAGIVADSNPEAEYNETLDKARSLLEISRQEEE